MSRLGSHTCCDTARPRSSGSGLWGSRLLATRASWRGRTDHERDENDENYGRKEFHLAAIATSAPTSTSSSFADAVT